MSTQNPTWREVARILARRLEHQAALAGAAGSQLEALAVGCPHRLSEADPENCPFCADRAAYRLWVRKERRS